MLVANTQSSALPRRHESSELHRRWPGCISVLIQVPSGFSEIRSSQNTTNCPFCVINGPDGPEIRLPLFPPTADSSRTSRHVRLVPQAINATQRTASLFDSPRLLGQAATMAQRDPASSMGNSCRGVQTPPYGLLIYQRFFLAHRLLGYLGG